MAYGISALPFQRGLRIAVLLSAGLLAACQTTPPEPKPAPSAELLQQSYDKLFPVALAENIGKRCRSIRFNRSLAEQDLLSTVIAFQKLGYSESQAGRLLAKSVPEIDMQNALFDWIKKRNVIVSQPATFCAAGRAEIMQKTQIGRYLLQV